VLERPPVVRSEPERVAVKRRKRDSKVSLGIVAAALLIGAAVTIKAFVDVWPTTDVPVPADAIYAYPPPGTTIGAFQYLMLEGTGREARRLERLRGEGEDLVLKAVDDVVIVKVDKTWLLGQGQLRLTPTRPLIPNRRYTLLLDRIVPGAKPVNGAPDADSQFAWTTADRPAR
jgi:hypothetical protein